MCLYRSKFDEGELAVLMRIDGQHSNYIYYIFSMIIKLKLIVVSCGPNCVGSKRLAKVLECKGGGFFSGGEEVGCLYELQLEHEGHDQVLKPTQCQRIMMF
jgi:hypothetical protein